ncbi:carbohydrate ABC transporter permease [Glycomyces artemisiae]|uniref:Multiple sugar transport system permease protein n=2 Tax=Glycomyces artemisiae TaxID=1076443 RepID=A0A2T0UG11_9ACTN|nr:carbohydrate ABC transporter permease [Glycomyces artemisiae]PRY56842.1 multiple sugar transport system permease protein [Glycomyces artemisiae]
MTTTQPTENALRRRRRGTLLTLCTTLGALLLAAVFLMPLGYGIATSLKDKDGVSDPDTGVLPVSALTFDYEGETHDVYAVPMPDGSTRDLALIEPGRESSVFIDPDDPEAGPIEWDGRWRTLDRVTGLDPQWGNFTEAWNTISFLRLTGWTLMYALVTMAFTVASSAWVAYGFARFRFPGRGLLFGLLMATILLPPAVTLVPKYAVFLQMGWVGTYLPLIVPQLFANAFNVFLLRQYFLTIPRELEEAARIDGAGPIRTFLRVIVPQSIPALTAVSLFHFFYAWNDFFEPLLYLAGNRDIVPIGVGLSYFSGVYNSEPHLILAASLLALALPVAIFLAAQRVFVQGIVVTGVDK